MSWFLSPRIWGLLVYSFGKQFTNPQAGFTKKFNERFKSCDVELLVVYSLYFYLNSAQNIASTNVFIRQAEYSNHSSFYYIWLLTTNDKVKVCWADN